MDIDSTPFEESPIQSKENQMDVDSTLFEVLQEFYGLRSWKKMIPERAITVGCIGPTNAMWLQRECWKK